MEKQFAASEVRRLSNRIPRSNDEIADAQEALRAFADMLEAREEAVPVGCLTVQRFRGSDAMVNHDFDYYGSLPDGSYSLYTQSQSAPADAEKRETMTPRELAKRIERGETWKLADEPTPCQSQNAERLAEALQEILDYRGGAANALEDEYVVERARQALAAHPTQAQPPAVSVPDIETMVNRFLSWRLPKPWSPDNGISYTRPNYAHEPAEHDWPTGTNLFDAHQAREMIEYMLAAQENPNG